MKLDIKIFATLLMIASSALFLSSCGDDTCVQADWIGTYNLVAGTDSCQDASVSVADNIIIAAGQTDTSLDFEGFEVNFTNCTATTFLGTMELDGDKITLSGICSAEFERQ